MPAWMTQWRSILGFLLLFTLVAVALGTLGAKLVLRGDAEKPAGLQWVEVCTDKGTRWVLMDLGVRR
jgi:hypothetical protein